MTLPFDRASNASDSNTFTEYRFASAPYVMSRESASDFADTKLRLDMQIKTQEKQFEQKGLLPQLGIDSQSSKPEDVLSDANASAQSKLAAVEALAAAGKRRVTIQDGGKTRECTIDVEKIGRDRKLVHLHADDDNGKSRVVLRGIANADGTFQKERDRSGREMSFVGDVWSSKMKTSNLAGADDVSYVPSKQVDNPINSDLAKKDDVNRRYSPDKKNSPNDGKEVIEPGSSKTEVAVRADKGELTPSQLRSTDPKQLKQFNEVASGAVEKKAAFQEVSPSVLVRYQKAKICSDGSTQHSRKDDEHYSPNTYLTHPDRKAIDTSKHPIFVMPGTLLQGNGRYNYKGVRPGDLGIVERDGVLVPCVFGDVGKMSNQGEVGVFTAKALGIPSDPQNGGIVNDYKTRLMIFRGSSDGTPQNPQAIRRKAFELLEQEYERKKMREA